MQVILMERVLNLGDLGDVVNVKPGYARNFLIPQGKAKRVTPENLADFEKRRAGLEAAQAEKLTGARELAAKLEGMVVTVTRKAGIDGRLFGSVTNIDITDALALQGVTVERSSVRLPEGPLKQIGDNPVQVALHSDVVATITVTVIGEQ
ncbi:MAG: 50S ribosomal protein L9 [Rhodocyclaceae bacterium]